MKILIAEDDPVSRRVLEANLQEWGFDVTATADGNQAWEIIQGPESPSLVISDWMMPGMDGLTLCRKIRCMDIEGYVYFILLTAKGEKKDIIEGLEAGADDFLTKPFNLLELKYRTRIGERIIDLEHRIIELANTDALTGLMNRRFFMERMAQEMARAERDRQSLSLIMTDIDHFKAVNDTYGHQVGDLVLQRFSATVSAAIRPYDFFGRYGGEEFVICLPGTDRLQAEKVAERIRKEVEVMETVLPDDSQVVRITASFGLASCSGESMENVTLLIKKADDALYQAKNRGRNCVLISSE
jgi:two-component system cell cycle response regulator